MTDISLYIDIVGAGVVPPVWYVRDKIKRQRLYFIRSGKGSTSDAAGNRIPFETGKIYIHPYNLTADYISDPDDPIDHIYFDFISAPPIISDTPPVYTVKQGSALDYTVKAAEALITELDASQRHPDGTVHWSLLSRDSEYSCKFRHILSLLLFELSHIKPIPYSSDETVNKTLEYIRNNYSKSITVTELSGMAGFELNYFIRRFKAVMGMTPYAYLRSFRLLKARALISQGKSLTEAAELVGYDNISSLSRALAATKA